jgi:hypothetical protein
MNSIQWNLRVRGDWRQQMCATGKMPPQLKRVEQKHEFNYWKAIPLSG